MRRILFLMVVCLAGIKGECQNFRADSLLMRLDGDPDNQAVYLRDLIYEYDRFDEQTFLSHLKKTVEVIENRRADVNLKILAFRELASFCWGKNFYTEGLNLYDRSIYTALEHDLYSEAGITYLHTGQRFMENEMYPQALERVYKANDYFLRANDSVRLANAHSIAAAIGFRAQNFALAVEEVDRALLIYKSLKSTNLTRADSFEIMSTLNTCGLAHAGLSNDDKAMACYVEAAHLAHLLGEKFWIGLIHGNKALIYARRGEVELAINSLQIDLQHSKAFRQWRSAISACITLADLMVDKKQWLQAKNYLDTASQYIQQYGGSKGHRSRYYKTLSKVYGQEGRVTAAYEALLRHEEISDSLNQEQQATSLTRIKTAHDIREKEREIQLLMAENKFREQQVAYRNIIVITAVVTILLLFILAFLIFRNYRQKKKDNDLLLLKNEEIKSINEELKSYADALAQQNQLIHKMNEDLELRVKKRTYELEEINSELDMFLYRASHDIRRPITTLLGLSNLANVTLKDRSAVHIFDKVSETATHMDRMLHKLQMVYALNRPLGMGSQIDLKQAIRNSVEKFALEMKQIGMNYSISANESVTVPGNESLYSIIFQNLVENAITFRKSDDLEKPCLWLDVSTLEEHVVVKIRDNGIGIESDYIEKIFDLHFRGTALSRGNGLGLYLVKKALHLLKGRIEVVSEYGVGSSFIIYFPKPAYA